jgi:hypothetical protein
MGMEGQSALLAPWDSPCFLSRRSVHFFSSYSEFSSGPTIFKKKSSDLAIRNDFLGVGGFHILVRFGKGLFDDIRSGFNCGWALPVLIADTLFWFHTFLVVFAGD